MTHKIAIIKTDYRYQEYDECDKEIMRSITEWTTVSDEDFTLLREAAGHSNRYGGENFYVVEQIIEADTFVTKTVADYLKVVKKRKAEEDRLKKEAAEKKAQRELKKRAKTEEAERKLFEELQKKFVKT